MVVIILLNNLVIKAAGNYLTAICFPRGSLHKSSVHSDLSVLCFENRINSLLDFPNIKRKATGFELITIHGDKRIS